MMKPSDRYETPPEVFGYWDRIFQFDLDVCAEPSTAKVGAHFTFQEDALNRQWVEHGSRIWCNPPYSNPAPWVDKAYVEASKGAFIAMLLPSDTSTKWFRSLSRTGISTVFLKGRVRFLLDGVRQGSPKFGSVMAFFWPWHLNMGGKHGVAIGVQDVSEAKETD